MLDLVTTERSLIPASTVARIDPNNRVPAEFIGLARLFRNEVKLVDTALDEALAVITAPLRARLKRRPKLRAEMLPDLSRRYEQLIPTHFRIGRVEGTKHKTEFAIVETRLSVSWLQCAAWDDLDAREAGVTICKFTFSVLQGRLRQRWTPLVNVSLHALARHVERHEDRSHAVLWHDLTLLAAAGEGGDEVATPGGCWLGSVITAGDGSYEGRSLRLRNVRTWVSAA